MTVAVLTGFGLGLGVYLLIQGLWPHRPPLAAVLAPVRGTDDRNLPASGSGSEAPWRLQLGGSVAAAFQQAGIEFTSIRADLAIMGRSLEGFLAEKIVLPVAGLLLIGAASELFGAAGFHVPAIAVMGLALLCAVGGFFLPELALRSEAVKRRRDFRHAVGSFLDLVAINLAGGSGVEGALHASVRVGHGWAFARIRDALTWAELSGETPWTALGRLGDQLDIQELRELASSLLLAGNEGAKVRQSIIAKADSLRHHQLTEAEAAAGSATEQMSLPVALLLFGFLGFLGFPAITRLLSGL